MESARLETHNFEPFTPPPLSLRLLAQLRQHRQRCGRGADVLICPGLANGKLVRLRAMSGSCQVALAQQRQHLRGSNVRDAIHKVFLARGLTGLSQQSSRAGDISLGQLQAGKQHLTENEAVNHSLILPRQVEALSPVLLSSLQVVPFVEYTGQAKMRFVDNLKRLITCQLQDAPVGLGGQRELVFGFLYVAQADCRQDGGEDIPRCLAERDGFSKGPAGTGTVSQEAAGKPLRPASRRAESKVCGGVVLQG